MITAADLDAASRTIGQTLQKHLMLEGIKVKTVINEECSSLHIYVIVHTHIVQLLNICLPFLVEKQQNCV